MDTVQLDVEKQHELELDPALPAACSFFVCQTSDDKISLLCDAPSDVIQCMDGTQLNVVGFSANWGVRRTSIWGS